MVTRYLYFFGSFPLSLMVKLLYGLLVCTGKVRKN